MSSSSATKPALDKAVIDSNDDDDDLDDLDDVLDQFGLEPKPSPSAPPPTASTSTTFPGVGKSAKSRPRTNTRVDARPSSTPGLGPPLDPTAEDIDEDLLSTEFASELAKGMENLLHELGAKAGASDPLPNPASASAAARDGNEVSEEQARVNKAAWEAMPTEGMNGTEGGSEDPVLSLGDVLQGSGSGTQPSVSTSGNATARQGQATNFQDNIKQAMDKLKEAEGKVKSAEAGGPNPESMEELLKSLQDLGLGDLGADGEGGEGPENEAELAGFLENMMSQLMSKDILYEPLQELADGFPGYLANPPQPLSTEERTLYTSQFDCVKRILAIFDDPLYSDTNLESNKRVVDLMAEMQSFGSPPSEIMGPLPPGFDGPGGLPGLNPNDENCTIA